MHFAKKNFVAFVAMSGALALGSSAFAEAFSFTSSGEATGGVQIQMPNGAMAGGGSSAGTTTWNWVSGGKTETTYVCFSMTQPPQDLFDLTGACDVSEGGKVVSSVLFGCNYLNAERTESNCVGGLFGKDGDYKGKSGTISWHGKEGGATGAGHWND